MLTTTRVGKGMRAAEGPLEGRAGPAERQGTAGGRGFLLLAVVLALLALGMAVSSILGPLGFGLLQYRTSPTTLNQLEGSDAAVLLAVVPATILTAVLAVRRHPAAPPLAAGIGVFTLYTYAQVVIGQEYLRLPGNVERFFPLLLAVFVLAEAALVVGWRLLRDDVPLPGPDVRRACALALFLVVIFLVLGLHLRTMVLAWQDPARMTEYVSSPTPFWLVKLMDLGIVVPAALVIAVGLWRGAPWAARPALVLLTGYTGLAVSVTAMAVLMQARDDPDASLGLAVGFGVFALVFVLLLARLYRPLFVPTRRGPKTSRSASPGPAEGPRSGGNLVAKRRTARNEQQPRSSR
jgi:hypothetical protein